MKKTLWMLGVAVAALTSCTESEVLDVPESKMIGFDTFVDKPTRALSSDVNTANLNGFYVYGAYGDAGSQLDYTVSDADYLNGDKVYLSDGDWVYTYKKWVANKTFRFAAYADGNPLATNDTEQGKYTNVTFFTNADDNLLTEYNVDNGQLNTWGLEFTGYTAAEKDLIAAVPFPKNPGDLSSAPDNVNVTFKHLLAKVIFEFRTTSLNGEKLSISPITFSAAKTGDCLVYFGQIEDGGDWITDPQIVWNPSSTNLPFTIFPQVGDKDKSWTTGSVKEEFYVIPQSNAGITLSDFVIKTLDNDDNILKTIPMNNISLNIPTHNKWLPGQVYRYYADVTPGDYSIVFSASVSAWSDLANRDHNISTTP